MLEFLFRIFTLILFVILSFGIGPTILSTSSFLGFLLVAIFAQIHNDDFRQFIWLIVYGIIADAILGATFGIHGALYLLCASLCVISVRKISSYHISSKTSLVLSSVFIIVVMTVLYEIIVQDMTTFFATWKNILIIVLGTAILYIPLHSILTFVENIFQRLLLARNYKKHR